MNENEISIPGNKGGHVYFHSPDLKIAQLNAESDRENRSYHGTVSVRLQHVRACILTKKPA